MTKEEAKQKIAELVEKYQKLTAKEIKGFNEEATKQGFIEPMFKALGWDFENTNEVSPEEHASEGRVDYAFKLNGVSQFYVEAKPFKEDVNDPKHIKQAVTYAFTKGVTWGVLTNFSGIRVFNAHKDWAFISLDCKDYLTSFDKLWLLSHESMETGLLKQEAINWGILPTPIPIEKRLFAQLRQWRGELFSQLRGHNKLLTRIQIDDIIQKFFNRLLFIRNCEDRGIEEPRLLSALNQWKSTGRKKEQLRKSLYRLFEYYNTYYDSDLFDKHLIDSDNVTIEEDTLENILSGLYDIPSTWLAYDFKLIDADVLGAVYEQYLGYVAIKAKEKAEAQLKLGIVDDDTFTIAKQQSHRKEQGIYYTPEFITEYIVKETVGRFIKEHSPQEPLKIRKMKILDPACGSGSFLIRAYNELLLYHAYQRGKSVSDLTKDERTTILLDNIFGVDLDKQAVEVARLNLLIRSLSGQYHLPPLKNNIKQGNSLISGKEEELKKYFGDNWEDKNPFNWEDEFKDVIKNGGFDVVIGNPPYVRIQSLPGDDADYYRNKYETAFGSFDIYVLFLEKGISLLKQGGRLGFITSGKFLRSDYGKKLQQLLLRECTVEKIIDLSSQQIFTEATTYPVILVLKKGTENVLLNYYSVPNEINLLSNSLMADDLYQNVSANQSSVTKGIWPPVNKDNKLMSKFTFNTEPLGVVSDRIFQGLVTGADKIYILNKIKNTESTNIKAFSSSLKSEVEIEASLLRALLMGNDIKRYEEANPKSVILFPYNVSEKKATLIKPEEFVKKYPLAWEYLRKNKIALENRENGKMLGDRWYAFGRTQNLALNGIPKIITGVLADKSRFTYDKDGSMYFMGGGNAGGYGIILKSNTQEHYLYILGLLNSTFLEYYLHQISSQFRGGFFSYARRYIEKLPIYRINFNNQTQKAYHDKMVALVTKVLELNKQLQSILDYEIDKKQQLEKEIKATDEKIDNLVYDLYGITEEERKIVEGQTGNNSSKV